MPQRGSIDPNQIQTPSSKGGLITSVAITGVDHSGINLENEWVPAGEDDSVPTADSTLDQGWEWRKPAFGSSTIQQQSSVYALDTGTANAYAVTQSPAPTLVDGSEVVFKAANANTGASTLAVNGGSPIAIKKQGSTALASGDIAAGQIVMVVYDGTKFQMIGALGATSAPVVGTFDIGSGATGTDVALHGFTPRAGSFSVCKVSIKTADATVALTFTIKQNGVSIFSANPTLAGGTTPGLYSVGTLTTTPLSFAQDDLFTMDITSGSSSWQLTVQLR